LPFTISGLEHCTPSDFGAAARPGPLPLASAVSAGTAEEAELAIGGARPSESEFESERGEPVTALAAVAAYGTDGDDDEEAGNGGNGLTGLTGLVPASS